MDVSTQLTKAELLELEDDKKLARLFEMRTSIEPRYTLQDQADEMGVSVATVKRWAKGERFKQIAQQMSPVTRPPIIDAGLDYLAHSLLPQSLREAESLLDDSRTPATAKVNLINTILKYAFEHMNGDGAQAVRQDALEFLMSEGRTVTNIQFVINSDVAPAAYRDALRELLPDVIDGELEVLENEIENDVASGEATL